MELVEAYDLLKGCGFTIAKGYVSQAQGKQQTIGRTKNPSNNYNIQKRKESELLSIGRKENPSANFYNETRKDSEILVGKIDNYREYLHALRNQMLFPNHFGDRRQDDIRIGNEVITRPTCKDVTQTGMKNVKNLNSDARVDATSSGDYQSTTREAGTTR